MNQNKVLTGKPSIDRPWMQFYPKEVQNLQIPKCTLHEYYRNRFPDDNHIAVHYYGTDVSWGEISSMAHKIAKSLRTLGIGEDYRIPVFLHSVPEFLMVLFAAEKVGASVMCRDYLPAENAVEVKKMNTSVMFVHDFITQEEIDEYEAAGIKKFIFVSPYTYAIRDEIPEYSADVLKMMYQKAEGREFRSETVTWEEFLALGENYTGEVDAPVDTERPLYRSYTSGSTGISKQVVHCARGLIGVVHQMTFYASLDEGRAVEVVSGSSPSLAAGVISGQLRALAANEYLFLDSFSGPNFVLSIMRYRPNVAPMSPMQFELLMKSELVSADTDFSYIMATGAGSECFNNGQYRRAQKFLADHGSKAYITPGYGLSEAGSNVIFPSMTHPSGNGNSGMPMPLVNVGIFKRGTFEELGYGEYGEICVDTPGLRLC